MEITISNHANERYAERVQGISQKDKQGIKDYIKDNEEHIKEHIQSMVDSGTLVYKGSNMREADCKHETLEIYVNKTWVILIDDNTNQVITLFNITLEVGSDEIDEQYTGLLVGMLLEKQRQLESAALEVNFLNGNLKNNVKVNTNSIKKHEEEIEQAEAEIRIIKQSIDKHKKRIDKLTQRLNGYEEEMKNNNAILDTAKSEMLEVLDKLMNKHRTDY
jgi:hypothetical protein